MTIQSRSTLRAYFANNQVMTAQSFIDWFDSFAHLADSTAQDFNSDIAAPNMIIANASVNNMAVVGKLDASAANFTGRMQQGVSAAASAAKSTGDVLVCQESTVAGAATAQVAFLPTTTNIVSFKVKMLVAGSAAAGGVRVNVGNSDSRNFFGTITVSALGMYEITNVSARRLTGVSGRVEMVCSAASANTNVVGVVTYYQRA